MRNDQKVDIQLKEILDRCEMCEKMGVRIYM